MDDGFLFWSVMKRRIILRWFFALAVMCVIYFVSSQPSDDLPNFDRADLIVKKGGHMLGYGLLALSYWNILDRAEGKRPVAWLLAVLYAVTDEFHQSFVPGRHPSAWDVLIFDNLGALIALWVASLYLKRKRPDENA